jgi:hypothetical protein
MLKGFAIPSRSKSNEGPLSMKQLIEDDDL